MELPIQVAARIYRQSEPEKDNNGNTMADYFSVGTLAVEPIGDGKLPEVENPNNFVYTTAPSTPQSQHDNFMTSGLVEVGPHSFPVTHALPLNCTQSQVYYQTVFPLINLFLEGFDASVVSYGQKSTGKTYSLYGPEITNNSNEIEQGIVHRCVREIFAHMQNNADRTFAVNIGWVEICEDTINDLLGVGNVHCKSAVEVFHWLQIGREAKAMHNFGIDAITHTLFTITLEQQWISKEGLIQHRLSTASFSDLAGTERMLVMSPVDAPANIPKDTGLRALEHIVCTLTDPALMYSVNGNIPYNQTALTTLLKDSFGGRAQTLVILCISPLEEDASETISNLQFAFKMQCVRNFVVMNTFSDNNTPIQRDMGVSELGNDVLTPAVVENFGLQFAASQWLKLVSNAEGLFSKLMSNNGVSELDKEQIEEWLFLKQECEECLSSNEVLRSQKQLRPIQETDEPEETLSEPDVSCQQNSDNESDSESQRPDLAEKLELLMDELQIKTDGLVNDKYNEFMQRQPKPVMESQDSLRQQKRGSIIQKDDPPPECGADDRKASVGGRRRSIQPGASLSSAELVMLNRVASREQQASTTVAKTGIGNDNFIDMGSEDMSPNTVLPLRAAQNSPIEVVQKKLRKLESDIEARMRQIKEVEETMQLKQNIITELVKNSETRSTAKQRFNKKKSKLETEYEKAKKQLDKAVMQGKEKSEIERIRSVLEHLEQRLQDLISMKHIAGDGAQKVKKLQQSLHESKKLMEDLQKKVKKERKIRDHLLADLKQLKEKENDNEDDKLAEGAICAAGVDTKQLKEMQARISHLDHVLREKSENLAEYTGSRDMNPAAENTNEGREGLRHEIRNLRRTRDHLLDQRCTLDRKLKREKILSYREERKLLECDEAIEAIDAAIEFKNELICGHKSIDTSERLQREKGEQMLMARLNKLSSEEMRTLLYKYFNKVIDLRDSSRKLEVQLMQLERERDAWEWKERALSNAVRQARLEGERNAVLLQRQHEMKLTLMLRHLADETSLSSSGFSDQLRPTHTAHRYLNLTPSGTDSDFELDFYKNSRHTKMLKPPKHSEIEICPTLPDALTKYKPLDKLKDKERESKNKLLAKFQVLTRYAGQSVMPAAAAAAAAAAASAQHSGDNDNDIIGRDDNDNGNHLSTFDGGATIVAQTGGSHRKKKDKSHKDTHATNPTSAAAATAAGAAAAIPQENLKKLISTPPTTKVTRQKNKIIIQDASRKN